MFHQTDNYSTNHQYKYKNNLINLHHHPPKIIKENLKIQRVIKKLLTILKF